MNSRIRFFTGAGTLLLAMAIPGAAFGQHGHARQDSAQAHPSGMMTGQGMMGGQMGQGMMSMMGTENSMMGMGGMMVMRQAMYLQPMHVLQRAEDLGLTSEQRARLDSLASAHRAEQQGWMTAMREANQKLWALFDSEKPDADAIRRAGEEAFTSQKGMYLRMLTDALAVREILTPDQLETLQGEGGGMMMHQGG